MKNLKPEFYNLIAQNTANKICKIKKCKKEKTKPGIKYPKHILGLHQEDTGI